MMLTAWIEHPDTREGAEASERVDLVLLDTGVVGGSGLFNAPEETADTGSCGTPAPQVIQLGAAPVGR